MSVVCHSIRKKIIEAFYAARPRTRRIALVKFIAMSSDRYDEDRSRSYGSKRGTSPAQQFRMRVGAAEKAWAGCEMPDAVMHDEFKHGERVEAWRPGTIVGTDHDDVKYVGWLRKYKIGRKVNYEIMPTVFQVTTFYYDESGHRRVSYATRSVFSPDEIAAAARELSTDPKNADHGVLVERLTIEGEGDCKYSEITKETFVHREPGEVSLADGSSAADLAASLRINGCKAYLKNDRIVFENSGGRTHCLAISASTTERVMAHWQGFACLE